MTRPVISISASRRLIRALARAVWATHARVDAEHYRRTVADHARAADVELARLADDVATALDALADYIERRIEKGPPPTMKGAGPGPSEE